MHRPRPSRRAVVAIAAGAPTSTPQRVTQRHRPSCCETCRPARHDSSARRWRPTPAAAAPPPPRRRRPATQAHRYAGTPPVLAPTAGPAQMPQPMRPPPSLSSRGGEAGEPALVELPLAGSPSCRRWAGRGGDGGRAGGWRRRSRGAQVIALYAVAGRQGAGDREGVSSGSSDKTGGTSSRRAAARPRGDAGPPQQRGRCKRRGNIRDTPAHPSTGCHGGGFKGQLVPEWLALAAESDSAGERRHDSRWCQCCIRGDGGPAGMRTVQSNAGRIGSGTAGGERTDFLSSWEIGAPDPAPIL